LRVAAVLFALAARALAGAASAAEESPEAAFLVAHALADEGRLEEAVELLDSVAARVPADPWVRIERAGILMRLGQLERAAADSARALELAPDDPDVLRLAGRVGTMRADVEAGAAAEAIEAFERLRRLQPEDLETLVTLGQLYLGTDRAQLAADALAEAARLRPGHPGIESLLERALAATTDLAQAERIGRQRMARAPGEPGPRLELADLLAAQGRHREAAEVLEQAPGEQLANLDLRRRLGLQLLLAGELGRARSTAAGIVDEWPQYGGGRLLLARIETAYGRFAEAEVVLSPLLARDPLPEAVGDLQVRILEGLGRVEEAAARLRADAERRRAAGRAVEADVFALDEARLWFRHGRHQEALAPAERAAASTEVEVAADGALLAATTLGRLARFDEALARLGPLDPERPPFAARRIGLLLDAGREAEARAEIERLLGARPEADLQVGAMLADRERWSEALPLLESAAAREPASLEAGFRLAAACERSGRIEVAVERFGRLLERAPDFAPALNYLGYLWIDRGENLERALPLVEEATRLDPDNGAYVDSLGWGYFRAGRLAEAVETLERAARLLPGDATVLEHLGDARLAGGDRERAAEAYRSAAAADPAGPGGAAARKLAALERSH
jgi:tetratricopeptide (TPR) repeat protein